MYKVFLVYDPKDGELLSKSVLDEQYSEEVVENGDLDVKKYNTLILKSKVGSVITYDDLPFKKVKKLDVYTYETRTTFNLEGLLVLDWTPQHFQWFVFKKVKGDDVVQHSNFLVEDGKVVPNPFYKQETVSFLVPEDKDSILIKLD